MTPALIAPAAFLGASLVAFVLGSAAERATDPRAAAVAAPYVVAKSIPLDGDAHWDYVLVDEPARRLYVAHGSRVDIVDTRTDELVGRLDDTPGVHGAAVAADLDRVFTSDGADDTVGVFQRAGGRRIASVKVGRDPDAIVYEPTTQRVVTFNGRSADATVVDARTLQVLKASIPVGGKPEFAVADGRGQVFFNVEDTAEVAVLDLAAMTVSRRWSIAPCQAPTGLDRDPRGRLYSVCANGLMVVSDAASGRVVARAPIGRGPDGVVWVAGRAISANGRDGTMSVIDAAASSSASASASALASASESASGPDRIMPFATVPTARGARTLAVDRASSKLYLPTADYEEATPASGPAPAARPRAKAGSFHVLVMVPALTAPAR